MELCNNGLVTKMSAGPGITGSDQDRNLSIHRLVHDTLFHQQGAPNENRTLSSSRAGLGSLSTILQGPISG